jgi:hypothetical protein
MTSVHYAGQGICSGSAREEGNSNSKGRGNGDAKENPTAWVGFLVSRIFLYFLAGVVWVVLVPERTEWSPLARESRIVSPIEVSMKMIAE